jgi:hypothetical protein
MLAFLLPMLTSVLLLTSHFRISLPTFAAISAVLDVLLLLLSLVFLAILLLLESLLLQLSPLETNLLGIRTHLFSLEKNAIAHELLGGCAG